jgi:hypothetical protein
LEEKNKFLWTKAHNIMTRIGGEDPGSKTNKLNRENLQK